MVAAGWTSCWSGGRKKGEVDSEWEIVGDGRGISRGELKDAWRFEWDGLEGIFDGWSLIVVGNRKGTATKLPRADPRH